MTPLIRTTPRKVWFFGPRLHENYAGWISALRENGFEVTFLSHPNAENSPDIATQILTVPKSLLSEILDKFHSRGLEQNEDLFPEDISRSKFLPSVRWLISRFLADRPEIFISRDRSRSSYLALACAKLVGIKSRVIYVQELEFDSLTRHSLSAWGSLTDRLKNLFLSWLAARNLPTLNPLCSADSTSRSFEAGRIGNTNEIFCPFVIDPFEEPINREYMPQGKLRIMVLAKYRKYKNLELIPKALSLMAPDLRSRIQLVIAGRCSNLQEQARKEGLGNELRKVSNIEFVLEERLSRQETRKLFADSDVILLPSSSDLAPIAPLEGMRLGVVPIVSTGAGTSCFIESGKNGFVFDPDNPAALAKIIEGIICSTVSLMEVSNAAILFSGQVFSRTQFNRALQAAGILRI